MCVADAQMQLSMCSSSALSIHPQLKCVRLQLQNCSSPAQNAFVTSNKVFISSLNTFVFSTKSVRPQHKKCSSLTMNMFVRSVICIWRAVAKTILSLAINTFVFCVEVGLETPKMNRNYGKIVSDKSFAST